jgi:hypothetical protein
MAQARVASPRRKNAANDRRIHNFLVGRVSPVSQEMGHLNEGSEESIAKTSSRAGIPSMDSWKENEAIKGTSCTSF